MGKMWVKGGTSKTLQLESSAIEEQKLLLEQSLELS